MGGWQDEERDSGMPSVPAVTPLTSRGRLASRGVKTPTCQDLILVQKVPQNLPSSGSFCVSSQCVSSSSAESEGPKQTSKHSIKRPRPFFVNTRLLAQSSSGYRIVFSQARLYCRPLLAGSTLKSLFPHRLSFPHNAVCSSIPGGALTLV